jgi:hypothetical protein
MIARPIPDHVSSDKASKAYFGELWALDVLVDGVRTPYVVEAFAGRNGWVMTLPPNAEWRRGKKSGKKIEPLRVKRTGHVELRWREAGDV